jgi:hypothetical protein
MRLAVLAFPLICALGCGGVTVETDDGASTDDDDGGAEDGGTDDGADDGGADDGGDGPPCAWSDLDVDPLVNVNTTDHEDSSTFSGDGLVLFFTRVSDAGEQGDVFDATREALGQPFTAARLITELSSPESETDLDISASGDEIFFLREDDDEILTATRAAGGGPFGEVTSTGLSGFTPSLSGDGLDLYFLDRSQDRILRVSRAAVGEPWEAELDVGQAGSFAWIDVSADGLRLLLSGGLGNGPDQPAVAVASRASRDNPFGEPVSAGGQLESVGDTNFLGEASWDASETQIVVTGGSPGTDGSNELHLSTCQ